MTKTRPTASGVRLGNMHRVKGLEFRCVAITNVSDEEGAASLRPHRQGR